MDNYTLSVVLPNYNHARYIGEALEAILSQSFRPLEIIVVDDGSTDESIMVIEKFASKDPIIKILRNETNQGVIFSVNRALKIVSGKYVYFAAADDRVLPGFFEKSINLLAQYPQAGLCCSWPTSLEEATDVIHENRLSWSEKPLYFSPEELAEVIQGGYIAGHTSIIKRNALLEAGGYISELKWHSDWFLVHVIAFKYGVCYIPESLAAIRVSKKTYSASGREDYTLQSQVLNHLLRLLKSPTYRWLLPYFIRGSLMSHFGDEIVRVVMSHPEHWDIETLMLIQEPLWSWNQKLKHIRDHKALEEKIQHIYENGQTAMSKGHFEDALAIFGRLTEEFPHLSQGYILMSEAAMALGRYPLACDVLAKAVKLYPNDPGLYNRLGVAQHRNGKWNLAELAFKQALALDPTNLNARMNLAEIAQGKGQYEDAGQLYMEAIKDHPQNAELWLACGRYGMDVHRWDLAKIAYRRALALDPTLQEAKEALQKLGNDNNEIYSIDVNEVIPPLSSTEELPCLDIRPFRQQDEKYLTKQNLGELQGVMDNGQSYSPQDPAKLVFHGRLLMKQGNFQAAYNNFIKATICAPSYIPGHLSLASILFEMGKAADSRSALWHALQIGTLSTEDTEEVIVLCDRYIQSGYYYWAMQVLNTLLKAKGEDRSVNDRLFKVNYYLAVYEYRSKKILSSVNPINLNIEPTFRCNASCIICGANLMRTKQNIQRPDLSIKAFDNVKTLIPFASSLYLFGTGEPFIAENINYIIQETKALRNSTAHVRLSTNGKAATRESLSLAVEAGMHLQVSVDSGTPSLFEKIRHGVKFEQMLNTLRTFNELRGWHKPPELYFASVITKLNIGDLTMIFSLAREMQVDLIQMFNFDPVTPEHQLIVLSAEDKEIFEKQKEYLDGTGVPYISFLHFDNERKSNIEDAGSSKAQSHSFSDNQMTEKKICGVPWAGLIVRSDGIVNPCFRIRDSFGNLNQQSFDEIWNGPNYQKLRKSFADQTDFHPACIGCRDPVKTLLS